MSMLSMIMEPASFAALAEERRQGAYGLRSTLEHERNRKRVIDQFTKDHKQGLHDEIHTWRLMSQVDD